MDCGSLFGADVAPTHCTACLLEATPRHSRSTCPVSVILHRLKDMPRTSPAWTTATPAAHLSRTTDWNFAQGRSCIDQDRRPDVSTIQCSAHLRKHSRISCRKRAGCLKAAFFSSLSPLRRAFGRRLLQRRKPQPTSGQTRPRRRSCRASSTICTAGSEGNPLESPPKFPDGPAV